MRILVLLLLLVSAIAYPRSSCLKANDICNKTKDFSVEEYILCGVEGVDPFPVDPNILAPKGSGFMRKPEDCDGICVDIMSDADNDNLVCSNAPQIDPASNCTNFKNAKHCVTDTGSILIYVFVGIAIAGCVVCCCVYDQNREKECDPDADYSFGGAVASIKSKLGREKADQQMGEWKKMRL